MRNKRDAIIEAATNQLIDCGNLNFSQKKIASQMGISAGNLTYHFPTRASLIEAVIDKWFSDWEVEFKAVIKNRISTDEQHIREFIDWVMRSALDQKNARMFRELWAMANNDSNLANSLNNLYARAVSTVLRELEVSESSYEGQKVVNLLYTLACVSEGTSVVFSGGALKADRIGELHKLVGDLLEPAFILAIASACKGTSEEPTAFGVI